MDVEGPPESSKRKREEDEEEEGGKGKRKAKGKGKAKEEEGGKAKGKAKGGSARKGKASGVVAGSKGLTNLTSVAHVKPLGPVTCQLLEVCDFLSYLTFHSSINFFGFIIH